MSPVLLRAFARRLPQLRAEEALHLASIAAYGSGTLKDPGAISADWERVAQGVARPRPTAAERRAMAASLGIQIVDEQAN